VHFPDPNLPYALITEACSTDTQNIVYGCPSKPTMGALALDIALGAYDEWRAGVGVRRLDCCCCCWSQLKKLSKEGVKQIF